VARYDPETMAWSSLGGGGGEGVDGRVGALAVAGDDLYVGGFFSAASSDSVHLIVDVSGYFE
jgi:hypothetical protein